MDTLKVINFELKMIKGFLAKLFSKFLNWSKEEHAGAKIIVDLSLKKDKYIFNPSNNVNFLSSAFGLSEFSTSKVNKSSTDKNYNFNTYYKYAAILIIALFIGGTITTNYLNDINTSNQISYKKAEKEIGDKIQKATFVIDTPLTVIKLRLSKK